MKYEISITKDGTTVEGDTVLGQGGLPVLVECEQGCSVYHAIRGAYVADVTTGQAVILEIDPDYVSARSEFDMEDDDEDNPVDKFTDLPTDEPFWVVDEQVWTDKGRVLPNVRR